jgi:hypothetical protein
MKTFNELREWLESLDIDHPYNLAAGGGGIYFETASGDADVYKKLKAAKCPFVWTGIDCGITQVLFEPPE